MPTPSNHRLQLGLPGYLILFAPLAFALQRQLPPVVVLPSTEEQVRQIILLCRRLEVPLVPRGAGTGHDHARQPGI